MLFENEAAFEAALIHLLIDKYGWEPEILRYKTEEDLVRNWKQILFENNGMSTASTTSPSPMERCSRFSIRSPGCAPRSSSTALSMEKPWPSSGTIRRTSCTLARRSA